MGSSVGVFNDHEVNDLTDADKRLLKEHILNHIQTSAEIRRIVEANPRILTENPEIREILREKAGTLQKRLSGRRNRPSGTRTKAED